MTWTFVITFLAAIIMHTTPDTCRTDAAENFAVSMVISEGFMQPQLAHELMFGQFVERGCAPSANEYAGYAAALWGSPYHARAYFAPWTLDAARVEYLHALWHETLKQHYAINHFDAAGSTAYWWSSPAACPHGSIIVDDVRAC